MPIASDFKLVSAHAVIFTPGVGAFSQNTFLSHVLGQFATRYDAPVQAFPLPETAPVEFPRVILQSNDNAWRLQAGPSRIDSLCFAGNLPVQDIVRECAEVLASYVRSKPVPVGRVALILTRINETANPTQELINRFCSESSRSKPFNRSEGFEVHNHKIYQPQGIQLLVNSWVRCRAGKVGTIQNPTLRPAITVEQDINTSEDVNQRRFNADEIISYFERVGVEADNIMHLYFPNLSQ